MAMVSNGDAGHEEVVLGSEPGQRGHAGVSVCFTPSIRAIVYSSNHRWGGCTVAFGQDRENEAPVRWRVLRSARYPCTAKIRRSGGNAQS